MEKTGWKILAIVFVCLWIVTISLFSWIVWLGVNSINAETECRVNVCGADQYDSYAFDDSSNVCYCYADGAVAFQKYIG